MNESQMLDENETLDLLRAGRTGTEPPMADVTGPALRGGRRMRLRRQVAQGVSGLAFAGAAVLAITTGAPGLSTDGRTVIEPARGDRAVPSGPAAPTNTPPRLSDAEAGATARRLLVAALGPDFRIALSGGHPPFEYIELVPGKPSAKALPEGYSAEPDVTVSNDDTADDVCAPDNLDSGDVCEPRTLPNGLQVTIRNSSPPLEPSAPVALHSVYFDQPDGVTVHVVLFVRPETVDTRTATVPRQRIETWLQSFDSALVTAATDPRMVAGSGETDEWTTPLPDNYGRNQDLLREQLGPSFSVDQRRVVLQLGSAAAAELPGYTAEAEIRSGRSLVELDRMCDEQFNDTSTAPCERRTTPGGDVIVQTWADSDSNSASQGRTAIYFLQPDHDGVLAELIVREYGTRTTSTDNGRAAAILAWLKSHEDELIAAATDPRIAPDGEQL